MVVNAIKVHIPSDNKFLIVSFMMMEYDVVIRRIVLNWKNQKGRFRILD